MNYPVVVTNPETGARTITWHRNAYAAFRHALRARGPERASVGLQTRAVGYDGAKRYHIDYTNPRSTK